jgi:hypothetical protein
MVEMMGRQRGHAAWTTGPTRGSTMSPSRFPTIDTEWMRKIGEVIGCRGEVVAAPRRRLPVPYDTVQNLDTDTTRTSAELG